jgi:predicted HTH transcriptional regulator
VSDYIRKLIKDGEHLKQDFKFEISDVRKIAKTLVAFSNTAGGKLLVGVKDNGKIAGIRSEEEIYMIEAAAGLYCKPEVLFTARKWQIEGKTIMEFDIPKGDKRPYLAKSPEGKWLAYIREKDQNFLVNAIQLRVWKYESHKKGVFIPFTEKEKLLLTHLENNSSISLDEFSSLSGLKRRKASDILVRLISIGEIDIVYSGENIFYSASAGDGVTR